MEKQRKIQGDEGSSKPIIILKGDLTMTITCGSKYKEPGYVIKHATEKKAECEITKNLDCNKVGSYIINYDYTNEVKVKADQVQRHINVIEKQGILEYFEDVVESVKERFDEHKNKKKNKK